MTSDDANAALNGSNQTATAQTYMIETAADDLEILQLTWINNDLNRDM